VSIERREFLLLAGAAVTGAGLAKLVGTVSAVLGEVLLESPS